MCPICISVAAMAMAGTGSAGGLIALATAKLGVKRHPERCAGQRTAKTRQPKKAEAGK